MTLLAEFTLRLLFGLAAALLFVPTRQVPPAYFRTLLWVALGVSVLVAFDLVSHAAPAAARATILLLALIAYLASVAWGIGLPRIGWPLTAALAVGSGALLAWSVGPSPTWLELAGRLTSGLYLGAILVAMLLGHHYLTAPAMSIHPLVRATSLAGATLLARGGLAVTALAVSRLGPHSSLLLLMRWAMGLAAPAIGLTLAYHAARIRSTQSATGILYATMILALLGELASLVLGRSTGLTV